MKNLYKYALAVILLFSLGTGSLIAHAETSYTEINRVTITQLDKSWKIQFSQDVGSSVEEVNNNIHIVSNTGETIPLDETKTKVEHSIVTIYPKEKYEVGKTYTLYVESGITSKAKAPLKPPAKLIFTVEAPTTDNNIVYDKAGTYSDGTIKGNVTISAANVNLNNMVIEGNLIIEQSVGDGEVYFNNVEVKGTTHVLGGGKNSVYFEDSILATVIVNKNTGAVRVVVKGETLVQEVFLESSAILQEESTSETAGFMNVQLQESLRNSDNSVELIGFFETINVYAADVQINLPKNSTVNDLILAAVAKVQGQGIITKLEVGQSASGSQFETTPHSAVLTIGSQITVGQGENQTTITESYTQNQTTTIKSIEATPAYIKLNLENQLYNLSLEDFAVKVQDSSGKQVHLTGLTYDANSQMLFFEPIPYSEYDNYYTIQISPSTTSNKLIGNPVTTDLANDLGFSGKITDIYGNGVANATILVNDQYRATTNEYGYYFVPTYGVGDFRGSIQAPGYYKGSIIAFVTSNKITTGVNETIMRAASSKEWKIMVTWNGLESDVDSHLANEYFHVYYANREFIGEDGIQYVDLDWDDIEYYGPETTTIRQFQDGRYIFFLHNFSGQNALDVSDSKIQVFKGNSTEADYTFTVPKNTGSARYWGAFELYVSNNGETVELVPVDILTNSEDILIKPRNTLQNLIDSLDGYVIVDEANYSTALENAKQVLNNPNASFSQIVDAFNNLKKSVKQLITKDSNYLRIQYLNEESLYYLETSINSPLSFTFETKPYEYADVENDPWNTFRPGDLLHMSLTLNSINEDTQNVSNIQINIENTETGEVITKTTDEFGRLDLGTFTTEELLNLPKYKINAIMKKSGSYYIGIFLKSEKEYEIYDGYLTNIEDLNYIDVLITE